MARRTIAKIDAEVSRLFGVEPVWKSGVPIDVDDAAYTRLNIRNWMLRWHELGQLASRNLKWARVLADIELAITQLPESLYDFFQLYYVIGYTPDEVQFVMEWKSPRSFSNACGEIERRLCRQLLNRQIQNVCRPVPKQILPTMYDFHGPVGPRNIAM